MDKVKLGEICDILNGFAFKSENYVSSGIRVIRISNVQKGYIEDTVPAFYSTDTVGLEKYMLNKDDLLMSLTGNVGRVALLTEEFLPAALNQRVACLRLKHNNVLLEYIFHYLNSNLFEKRCISSANGVAQKNMSTEWLKDYEIPIVSLNEQRKIVNLLNKVRFIILSRKQQIVALDTLIKARFVEMFGDFDLSHNKPEWISISKIGKVIGGSTPKTEKSEYWNGEYRWISPAELKSDSGIIFDSVKKITKAGIESCSLQELPCGTVLLSSRAPIGKVAIAGNTLYCNQGFKNIVCGERVIPRYLYSLFLFNTQYLNSLGRGATFKEISKNIVENIKIPVPKIEAQTQFAAFVEQVDKSKFVVQKALDKAQTLFDSLMQQYFG